MDALTRLRLRLPFVLAVRHKTQADLARALKISDSNISGLLHGRKGISLKMVDAFAAYLNVDFVSLFADQQAPVLDRQPARRTQTQDGNQEQQLGQVLADLRTLWLRLNDLVMAFEAALEAPPVRPRRRPRNLNENLKTPRTDTKR